jgi:hypothetical protein
MKRIYLTIDDAKKVLEIMKKFPDATNYCLASESSGIGSTTTLTVATTVNGVDGEFTTEISGVENW